MRLDRERFLVRWAYQFDDTEIPARTTLCAFFWRCVFLTPFMLAWLGLCTATVVILFIDHGWWAFIKIGLFAVGLCLTMVVVTIAVGVVVLGWDKVVGINSTESWWRRVKPDQPQVVSVLWGGAKAIKSRFCPLIDFQQRTATLSTRSPNHVR